MLDDKHDSWKVGNVIRQANQSTVTYSALPKLVPLPISNKITQWVALCVISLRPHPPKAIFFWDFPRYPFASEQKGNILTLFSCGQLQY